MTKPKIWLLVAITLLASPALLTAADRFQADMAQAHRWVSAKFEGMPKAPPVQGYLMVYVRSGTVQKNGIEGVVGGVQGEYPLEIGNKDYPRGLYCPSLGKIVVHLPTSAERFQAVVGVDSSDTRFIDNAGRGSVVASVRVSGKEAYHSAVMHAGMPAVPVNVHLGRATEFTLELSDTGNQTNWDQVDWAEARVKLENGRTLWLDELPIGPIPGAYSAEVPFSFRYGGQSSRTLFRSWELSRSTRKLDPERTEHTLIYTDPKTGLEVQCHSVAYQDFPTVEWTLYFKNTGRADTPILENIEPLDAEFERNDDGEFVLHYNKGSSATPTDFEPFEATLGPGAVKKFSPVGGRPTNGEWPYFNITRPGGGIIVAVGWPGEWRARFSRDQGQGLRIVAGQQLTHFLLHPGEQVRTPLIALQFYKGDWIRGQNIWRQWMIAHVLPRPGGKLPDLQLAANSTKAYFEMQEANEDNQKMFINRYLAEGVKLDFWWMDAGWYPFKGSWVDVGTWEPDPKRFPHGLRAISDYAHSKGLKIILWFEPERVMPGTWLYEHHPEWLLKPPPNPGNQAYAPETRLFNFGNPQARQWMIDHINSLIIQQGIDLYRQDFNMDPLYFWRANDAKDREGITEIRYVTGLLAYWDELRRLHPSMLIDTCASGGRRLDLETLRRAVPLTRSDYLLEAIGEEDHTYGIAMWLPYFGTEADGLGPYAFRSQMCPSLLLRYDMRRKNLDYGEIRRLVTQWRQVAKYYYGNYYPLSAYSTSTNAWVAWQFDRTDLGQGMVQAFRRPDSRCESARFKLNGLDASAIYKITNLDVPDYNEEISGRELTDEGLSVAIKGRPGALILLYSRIKR